MYRVTRGMLDGLLNHFAQTEQFIYFDTARPCQENRVSYLFEQAVARLQCQSADDPVAFLDELQGWLDKGYWLAGWFAYEFGEKLVGMSPGLTSRPQKSSRPLADMGVYSSPCCFDHESGNCNFPLETTGDIGDCEIIGIGPNVQESDYLSALEKILDYIRAGDTYQVNYTLKLLFSLQGSHEALYRELRRNQSVAYGAYWRWGNERVMSFSPELFFRQYPGGLTVRPMKGTYGRGRNCAEDAAACEFLHHDIKNRSENVMIVDLLRNDLGRVMHEAGGGDVRVRTLFDVERYESLLQMTSTIDGVVYDGANRRISLPALFRALFPCGSITGAPKIRTMEIIRELEYGARGVYTGAIGFMSPTGEAVFNVPIRTLVFDGQAGEMGIGGGITHDSDPGDEWRECLLKGRFLTSPAPVFELIETMISIPGQGVWLQKEHLARLAASAEYFSFSCNSEAIAQRITEELTGRADSPQRLRLTLAKDGAVTLAAQPCELPSSICLPIMPEPLGEEPARTRFSGQATDSSQPWLMHKTTRRQLYNEGFARAQLEGLLDLLYVNERGEVTEGAITNIFIYREGEYLTPPVDCGLLAGTLRNMLLAEPGLPVREAVLYPDDVYAAEAVFLVNSVRGVVRVRVEKG